MRTTLSFPQTMKKQTGHWWQNAFSFSSSSSAKSTSDDSLIAGRFAVKPSLFSSRGGRSSRLLARAKKLRDVEFSRGTPTSFKDSPARLSTGALSPAAAAPPSPHPLPLPELQTVFRRDAKFASDRANLNNVPLPSPNEAAHQRDNGAEEKDKEKSDCLNGVLNNDAATSSNAAGRLLGEDAQRNIENTENWSSSRKSPPKLNGSERNPNNYRMNTPISAPASPYSSPAHSPHGNIGDVLTPHYVAPPSLFQVWSAPEMPSADSTLVPGFSYQISSEIAAFAVDNSPLPSPKVNLSKSPNGHASPLCNKLSTETSMARRDSNAQASVHPLPLPPGAAMPSQPIIVPHLTQKQDIVPMKSQWQKGKLIGRGTFGSVYVASNRETGALCAMKEVEMLPDDPKSAECIRQLEQEIKVLSHLKHPNIVQYYGSEIVGDRFYIYLEYVHPGSINKFIRDHCGAITESVVRNFTRHILCGLAYLHSTKTIHRDIKGANLLVDAYGVVKLADFGMAKHLNGHAANLSLKGSPYWMAPELLQSVMQQDSNTDLALAIDIWSLGCTIIEMLNGKPPWSEYEGAAAMFKVLKEAPRLPENLSAEGKDFLRCCFRRNPAERASASTLLEHGFVRNSHPADVFSCTVSLGGMKLKDDSNSKRENLNYKLDQAPAYSDMQIAKGKMTDKFKHGSLAPVRLANDVTTKL